MNLAQRLLSEPLADLSQLTGDSAVFIRQIGMISTAVDDAQGMVRGGEVKVDPLHHRLGRVGEVDEDQTADGRSHLIHQAAGLTKEGVLCILSDLGNLNRGELPIAEQVVDDRADQHLKGC